MIFCSLHVFQNPSWESVQFTPQQFQKYAALPSIFIISYLPLTEGGEGGKEGWKGEREGGREEGREGGVEGRKRGGERGRGGGREEGETQFVRKYFEQCT